MKKYFKIMAIIAAPYVLYKTISCLLKMDKLSSSVNEFFTKIQKTFAETLHTKHN